MGDACNALDTCLLPAVPNPAGGLGSDRLPPGFARTVPRAGGPASAGGALRLPGPASCTTPPSNTMRLHVLESRNPLPSSPEPVSPVDEDGPAGLVWQTQQPLIISNLAEESRWPQFPERVKPFGVNSLCFLPLTTARRRLGVLAFACKQAGRLRHGGRGLPATGRQPGGRGRGERPGLRLRSRRSRRN